MFTTQNKHLLYRLSILVVATTFIVIINPLDYCASNEDLN